MKYFIEMFKNTLDFKGRTKRYDFWIAILFNIIFSCCAGLIAFPFILEFSIFLKVFAAIVCLCEVVLFVPTLSLTLRRIHDAGYSAWMVFVVILPIIGWLALIYFLCQPSINDFGITKEFVTSQNIEQSNIFSNEQTFSQSNNNVHEEQQIFPFTEKAQDDETLKKSIEPTTEQSFEKVKSTNIDEQQKPKRLRKKQDVKMDAAYDDKKEKRKKIEKENSTSKVTIKSTKKVVTKSQKTESKKAVSKSKSRGELVRTLQHQRDSGAISEEEYKKEILKILK